MKKRLLVEIEGEFYDSFNAMTYILKVENSECSPLNICLSGNQSVENFFFEILENCGIEYKKMIFVTYCEDKKIKNEYLKENNNIIIKPKSISRLIIENTGNIVLSAKSSKIMNPGFTIDMSMGFETVEETLESLSNILDEIGASYEVR
jgi:hypothetical protein